MDKLAIYSKRIESLSNAILKATETAHNAPQEVKTLMGEYQHSKMVNSLQGQLRAAIREYRHVSNTTTYQHLTNQTKAA